MHISTSSNFVNMAARSSQSRNKLLLAAEQESQQIVILLELIEEDDTVPDLLVLPPGADLHNHPLVLNGSVLLQGKASSMAAVALDPKLEWEVIDACLAPRNKTVHLAALMNGKGKIIACELNKERVERLRNTVKLAGATSVEVKHEDFLNLDPTDPSYSKVRAILLDPSCSGSGTAIDRLDHLLPSHTAGQSDHVDEKWLQRLASFQKRVLEHALSCKQQSIACSSHPRQFLLFVICQILPHQNQPTITTRSLNR